jgi:hypothetical protein
MKAKNPNRIIFYKLFNFQNNINIYIIYSLFKMLTQKILVFKHLFIFKSI